MKTELKTEKIYYFLILSYFQCVANRWILRRQVKADKIIIIFSFCICTVLVSLLSHVWTQWDDFQLVKISYWGAVAPIQANRFSDVQFKAASKHSKENALDSIKHLNIFLLNNCVNEDGRRKAVGPRSPVNLKKKQMEEFSLEHFVP